MDEILSFECPSCGAKISMDKKFCDYCGSQIKIQDKDEKGSSPQIQPSTPQESSTITFQQTSESVKTITQSVVSAKKLSGIAVVSFILSLLGLSPISLILGIIAIALISNKDSNSTGRGFAIAAIIISFIQIIIIIGGVSASR